MSTLATLLVGSSVLVFTYTGGQAMRAQCWSWERGTGKLEWTKGSGLQEGSRHEWLFIKGAVDEQTIDAHYSYVAERSSRSEEHTSELSHSGESRMPSSA